MLASVLVKEEIDEMIENSMPYPKKDHMPKYTEVVNIYDKSKKLIVIQTPF